jgi:hypothetical protein
MVSAERKSIWKSEGRALSGVPWSGAGVRSPLKLTTFSRLEGSLNSEHCTLLGIIYAANNAKICAETLLIYKLDDNDYVALSDYLLF